MTASSNPTPSASAAPSALNQAPAIIAPVTVILLHVRVYIKMILLILTIKGIMAYHPANIPIPVPFDDGSKEISNFNSQLTRRPDTAGWDYGGGNILLIPDSKGITKNLIIEYGCLTTDDIKAHANTYLNQRNRQAQNNQMMMHCLLVSLTKKYFKKISNDHKTYTENNVESATLLFKLLMSTSI